MENFNLTNSSTVFTPRPFVKEWVMTIKVLSPLWVGTILFGLMSNITNVLVFLKAGVKDNVTVLLLSLAISDLIFLVLISPTISVYIIIAMIPSYIWPLPFHIPLNLFYWPAFTAYDLSALIISVSLGLIRCACVAMPLKFKFVFTMSRTVKWVMFIVVLAISLRLPILTVNRLAWRVNPATNKTGVYLCEELEEPSTCR
ncbi:chemosensory receptor C [Elysia marginata]|uniref:Chemosensory receptor C n=1 Tax=Elysia marginata TaxID=1093978 RepID=A0AAV4EAP2_9GAST|nr:chemosensory receptor C [Elysia marginata]